RRSTRMERRSEQTIPNAKERAGIGILLTACLQETLDGEWEDPEIVSLAGSKPLFFNESRARVFYHFGFTNRAPLHLIRVMYCTSRVMIGSLDCGLLNGSHARNVLNIGETAWRTST